MADRRPIVPVALWWRGAPLAVPVDTTGFVRTNHGNYGKKQYGVAELPAFGVRCDLGVVAGNLRGSAVDQPARGGPGGDLRPRGGIDLGENITDVVLDRALADHKLDR